MARYWTIIIVAVGTTFCLIPSLRFFWLVREMFAPPPVRLTSLREVTRIVPLVFPKDAVLIDGTTRRITVNGYLGARIRMRRGEVRHFLSQPPFHGRASSKDSGLLDDSFWMSPEFIAALRRNIEWHPETVHHFLSSSSAFPTGAPNDIYALIDLDDPASATLYLYYQE